MIVLKYIIKLNNTFIKQYRIKDQVECLSISIELFISIVGNFNNKHLSNYMILNVHMTVKIL